jgi:hypothetical protein
MRLDAYFAVSRTAHRLTSHVTTWRVSSDRRVVSTLNSDLRVGSVDGSNHRVSSILRVSANRVDSTPHVVSTGLTLAHEVHRVVLNIIVNQIVGNQSHIVGVQPHIVDNQTHSCNKSFREHKTHPLGSE